MYHQTFQCQLSSYPYSLKEWNSNLDMEPVAVNLNLDQIELDQVVYLRSPLYRNLHRRHDLCLLAVSCSWITSSIIKANLFCNLALMPLLRFFSAILAKKKWKTRSKHTQTTQSIVIEVWPNNLAYIPVELPMDFDLRQLFCEIQSEFFNLFSPYSLNLFLLLSCPCFINN